MYIGLLASRARFCAVGTVVHCPELDASWMVAAAGAAPASRVMPIPFNARAWPRSMVRVPSHAFGHQSVPASPSMAFEAGSPGWDESALACPDSAQSMPGPCLLPLLPAGAARGCAAPGRAG